jgi:hypothetical protein
MTIYKESRVLEEVRRIKEEIAKEADKAGPEIFYPSLNGTAARLISKYRTKKDKKSP